MHPIPESVPMLTADLVRKHLDATLSAAQELLCAAAKEYRERLPEDAHAWATLLALGRVAPSMMLDFPAAGARVALGYRDQDGTFHAFVSWPLDEQAPPSALN